MTAPDLSVVIPTKDRLPVLLATLARLDAQDLGGAPAEVVVVDNGSRDGTCEAVDAGAYRLPVQVLSEPRRGPAAARNTGARAAAGAVLLFLGDDMAPAADDLLRRHAELHAAQPQAGYGVLGRVAWSPHVPVTPFMRWLDASGTQFSFERLAPGRVAAREHFYTSQVSVKKALFDEVGGFDERFPHAAIEDAELGLRLERAGLELEYHPELLVHHDHPTDIDRYGRRMIAVGESAHILHSIGVGELAFPRPRRRWAAYPLAARLARVTLALRPPARLREAAWVAILLDGYARGYRRAARTSRYV